MLKAEYLGTGTYKVDKVKYLDDNQLLVTAYPYQNRQNALNELVANEVVGGVFTYSCREIEAVMKQVLNKLPDKYNTFTEKDSRFCIKIFW